MYVAGASSSKRVTGSSSGIDVDATVKSLMKAESYKYDAVYQKKELAQYKMDAYRTVTTEISAFRDKYFDFSSTSSTGSNMLSESTLSQFTTNVSDDGYYTATAKAGASSGTHSVEVLQLATAAKCSGTTGVSKTLAGTGTADFTSLSGTTLKMTVDGSTRSLTMDSTVTDASTLQTLVDDTWGSGKITVATSGSSVSFVPASDSGVYSISLSGDAALTDLGFGSSDPRSNRLDTSKTLAKISNTLDTAMTFNSSNQVSFTINDVDFTFDSTDTLSEVMKEVNASKAGVTMSYDSSTDAVSIVATATGAGSTLSLSEDSTGFLAAFGLSAVTEGTDSISKIDGTKYTQSSNTLTKDNVTYKFTDKTSAAVDCTVAFDSDNMVEKITSFVTDYNALISSLKSTISESYDRDYPPLTQTQEDDMSDTEITSWNEKAKTGLLENDSIITNLMSNMRSTLYSSVSGCTNTLYSIGITTDSYENGGKLIIDSAKLKEAVEDDPQDVLNLFTQKSTTESGTSARLLTTDQRAARKSEAGLMWNLYDSIEDTVSTSTDLSGNKGTLLEKAGETGDSSATDNSLYKQITKYTTQLSDLETYLNDKEDSYYKKFTAMETYISKMNSQLSSFSSNFSSSS